MATNENREIKSRMVLKAAALWGISPKDIERSFDPLVTLLLDACASEIEKIETEIGNSQTRITERLIQLMTPEAIHSAQPAHAIAYAQPVENVASISTKTSFLIKKRVTEAKKTKQKNLFFSPTREMRIIKAKITTVVCGDQIYEQEEHNQRKLLGTLQNYATPSKMFLGIESTGNIPLKNVSLYLELQQTALNDLFYHHLKNVKCRLNGEEISIHQGFYDNSTQQRIDVDSIFNPTANVTQRIEKNTNQFYEKNFLTIQSLSFLSKKKKLPKGLFTKEEIEKYSNIENLNWLEIEFPRMIDLGILKEVHCSFNAFPVLNRKLKEFSYQLKDFVHIIPIQTDDLFLDLQAVQNVNGKDYYQSQNSVSEQPKGTFTIREDQSGKLDARSAKQFLRHMIELLKEESGSFSFLGSDFLQGHINKLNQTIFLLEKRAEDLTERSKETLYLSVKPFNPKETLTISFWTTDGQLANKIKAGVTLQSYEGTDIQQKTGYLITNTAGGKNSLGMQERLNAYRSALLSRKRIVSKQDVRALCLKFYNDRIDSVAIHKSFTTDISNHKGIMPCMKIVLTPSKKYKMNTKEWQILNNGLLSMLEEKSTNVFPFIIDVVT